ncbi:MAG: glycosyltransferase family 4 protein [Armatimonadetes bacterium]|nr:glycosyltransferase family 4 protein [Armatimonadota bacterium]
MRVAFYASDAMPFAPAAVSTTPLGGVELALFSMARALAALGHEVLVLNRCGGGAGEHQAVRYMDVEADRARWQATLRERPADALVVVRRFMDVNAPVPCRVKIYWAVDFLGVSHDFPASPVSRALAVKWRQWTGPLFTRRVDLVFVISRYMGDLFAYLFRTPQSRIVVTRHGIDPSEFAPVAVDKEPLRFIHTSVPDRGLDVLLSAIFPRVRAQFPEATLHLFSYRPLDRYREMNLPGVVVHGSVPRADLVRELGRSTLMLYPNTAEEMFCIAAVEAQAAGTPVVTSDRGALPEVVVHGETGVIVPGPTADPAFADRFAAAVGALVRDPPRLAALAARARERALTRYRWDTVAREWSAIIGDALRVRSHR